MRTYGRRGHVAGVYPQGPGGGGGAGGGGVPLSRQRFIDGDTAQTGSTGAASEPYTTIAAFIASRGNASIQDATANYVGWLTPSIDGYAEAVEFPPYASTELRADSLSSVAGSGVVVTGNVTWANIAGAFAATGAVAAMHNVVVVGTVTVTDDGGAPDSIFVFSGDEAGPGGTAISGAFVSSATTKLSSAAFYNAGVFGGINAGTASTSAVVLLYDTVVVGDILAKTLVSKGSSISAAVITVGASGAAAFINTSFVTGTNPVLTAVASAQFDGPSWRSFSEAGGTRAVGTAVLVVGGYDAGIVEGAALTGASTLVSLNGTGATAGWTGSNSGNHYSSASNTPATVRLLTGGGEGVGDTICVSRTTLGTGTLTIQNNASATIAVLPVNSRGFVKARYNGSDWVLMECGSVLA